MSFLQLPAGFHRLLVINNTNNYLNNDVQDLENSTNDSEERNKLVNAVALITEMAQYIEQSRRTSDNFLRLAEIQKRLNGFTEVHALDSYT